MTRLYVFGGPPGAGKTTLARGLAGHLGAVYLRIDSLELALAQSSLAILAAEDAGYRAAYAVARDNLALGLAVVADSVNPIGLTRSAWRKIASDGEAEAVEIEVLCSDPAVHRARIETRRADLSGQRLPNWAAVQARHIEPWPSADIRVDTAHRSAETCLAEIVAALRVG